MNFIENFNGYSFTIVNNIQALNFIQNCVDADDFEKFSFPSEKRIKEVFENGKLIIIKINNIVIGFGLVSFSISNFYIEKLEKYNINLNLQLGSSIPFIYINKNHRKNKLGTVLFQNLIILALKNKKYILSSYRQSNTISKNLHEKLKFEVLLEFEYKKNPEKGEIVILNNN
ncbi:MAG: GNAT family N-acetyltransferase [Nanoarchaeota archaeon]|nr:GNAT family N-acetyltransferase [Nanoarchaeota archaeon]